jgi:hypothetical protein
MRQLALDRRSQASDTLANLFGSGIREIQSHVVIGMTAIIADSVVADALAGAGKE